MKLELNRADLAQTLKLMHSILDRNPKMPLLKYLSIKAVPNEFTIAGTDLELGLQRTFAVAHTSTEELLIPAEPLFEFLRELETETIQFGTDNQHAVTVTGGKAKAKFKGMDAKDYPVLPDVPAPWRLSIPTDPFSHLLSETLTAAGEQDARYILNSIRLHLSGDPDVAVEAVSTDGHRLVVTNRSIGTWLTKDHSAQTLLLPKKTGKILSALMASSEEDQLAIGLSKSLAGFRLGPYVLTSRLMEGNYPQYQAVIPKQPKMRFTLKKAVLEDPLRRVSVIAGRDSKPIVLTVGHNAVTLRAVNVDLGEATETIDTPTVETPEPFVAGFNTDYLLDALTSMPGEHCSLLMDSPTTPCVFTSPEALGYTHIVMPVRVEQPSSK